MLAVLRYRKGKDAVHLVVQDIDLGGISINADGYRILHVTFAGSVSSENEKGITVVVISEDLAVGVIKHEITAVFGCRNIDEGGPLSVL